MHIRAIGSDRWDAVGVGPVVRSAARDGRDIIAGDGWATITGMVDTHASDQNLLRIVLLEDDSLLRERILLPRLADYGLDVTGMETAAELEAYLSRMIPHILVLDVGLPDADGFTLAQRMRRQHPGMGIVMLTGRGSTPDRVRGLSEGADAYLAKPVEVELLAATLQSVARRLRLIEVDRGRGWRLDAGGWNLLTPAAVPVPLTRGERKLVSRLLQTPGIPVLREDLIASMTEDVHQFDPHRLESMVHRLRRKATTIGGAALPLQAVHGEGYVFNAQS